MFCTTAHGGFAVGNAPVCVWHHANLLCGKRLAVPSAVHGKTSVRTPTGWRPNACTGVGQLVARNTLRLIRGAASRPALRKKQSPRCFVENCAPFGKWSVATKQTGFVRAAELRKPHARRSWCRDPTTHRLTVFVVTGKVFCHPIRVMNTPLRRTGKLLECQSEPGLCACGPVLHGITLNLPFLGLALMAT